MKFKKKEVEELELITGIENVNPEALEELCNGLGEDEDVEELMGMARQRTELVGANAANNKVFSPLCCKIIPSPNYNVRADAAKYGVKNNTIDTITIHHMAGNLTVETCGNIFANPKRGGSSNYGIGTDGRIAGYVGEENRAWTSSSKYNDFRAITIEVANNSLAPNWTVSEAALTSLYNLLVDVCRRNGIQKLIYSPNKNDRVNHINGCNVTIHSDFASTACLPVSTELLTPNGWVSLDKIKIGDKVASATLDGLNVSFEEVEDVVEPYYNDTYTNNDFTATKDHRMVYSLQKKKDWNRIETFGNLLKSNRQPYIPLAGHYHGKGLPISDNMIRFLIAVQADGCYYKEKISTGKENYYGVQFHFAKERKIERLKQILDSIGLEYKASPHADGTFGIRIWNQGGQNIVNDICEKYLHDKCFTWDWLEMSDDQTKVFFEEIMLWDGCTAANKYSSSKKINLDIVNAIAAFHNIGSRISGNDVLFRESPYITLNPETVIRNAKQGNNPENLVSCVSVKTGIILVRQNGKTFIVGNCCGPYLKGIMNNICTVINNLLGANPTPTPAPTPAPQPAPTPALPAGTPDPYADYSKAFWDFFRTLNMPEYGVAGLIGNIAMESAIRPNNLQNSFEKSLKMNDDQYTAAVDNGTYTNFAKDGAGYGLAQWTFHTRKQALLDFAKQCKMSICDINLQLTYLTQELQTKYKGVWYGLFAAKSVLEASNLVLLNFERPADQSTAAQKRRAECCQGYYDKFKGSAITTTFPIGGGIPKQTQAKVEAQPINTVNPYLVKITAQLLNVRSGAGINYPVKTTVKKNGVYTIIAEQNSWGKLKSGAGWIDLRYTKRV